jgi:hypothetical protein
MRKFAIGDRVSEVVTSRKNSWNRKVGKVLSEIPNDPDTYLVELDLDPYYKARGKAPTIKRYEANDLMSEAEAKDALDALENDFNKLQDDLKLKLAEAVKIIEEANKIAEDNGESLAEMHEATDPLLNAMDNAGWRTSSLSC